MGLRYRCPGPPILELVPWWRALLDVLTLT